MPGKGPVLRGQPRLKAVAAPAKRMTATVCARIARGLFYRGRNPGDTRRIRTGATFWDDLLFVADNEESARMYGAEITTYRLRSGARLLCEGTRDFQKLQGRRRQESLLDFAERVARAAAAAGYDAVLVPSATGASPGARTGSSPRSAWMSR